MLRNCRLSRHHSSSPPCHATFSTSAYLWLEKFYLKRTNHKPKSSIIKAEGIPAIDLSPTNSHNYDSCVIQKHQDIENLHNMCLSRLLESSKEVEALRQENNHLRVFNVELNEQLSLLIRASIQDQFDGSSCHKMAFDIANGFRGLHIADDNSREGESQRRTLTWTTFLLTRGSHALIKCYPAVHRTYFLSLCLQHREEESNQTEDDDDGKVLG